MPPSADLLRAPMRPCCHQNACLFACWTHEGVCLRLAGRASRGVYDSVRGGAGFPVKELKLFGSARSAGTKVQTKWGEVVIEDFSLEAARKMDVVFVSVSGDFSLEFCEKMADGPDGCVVIDNSSAFRMKEGFALCVPEINADAARKSNKKVSLARSLSRSLALSLSLPPSLPPSLPLSLPLPPSLLLSSARKLNKRVYVGT